MVLPGWGAAPVRVCSRCYDQPLPATSGDEPSSAAFAAGASGEVNEDERKVTTGRAVTETVGQAASMFSYVLEPTKRKCELK